MQRTGPFLNPEELVPSLLVLWILGAVSLVITDLAVQLPR